MVNRRIGQLRRADAREALTQRNQDAQSSNSVYREWQADAEAYESDDGFLEELFGRIITTRMAIPEIISSLNKTTYDKTQKQKKNSDTAS